MPCLNEAETLPACIRKAQHFLKDHNISGEIVVADNGSSEGSQCIAEWEGARLISVESRGYGAACAGGIAAARGQFVIMGDADDSYDFAHLAPFVERLRQGYDLVMGNRFKGGIEPGSMPFLHRYLGNPVLSGIGRLFFRSRVGDFQCGLRGWTIPPAAGVANCQRWFQRPDVLDILAGFREMDPRIHVVDQASNQGRSAARNTGLQLARTPHVVQLPRGDLLEPTAF